MIAYILFGAGTIGRLIARQLIAKGIPPVCFADNDQSKWGKEVERILVLSPEDALREYPEAKWVATIHRTPFRGEILEQLGAMEVEQVSLYEFLPARCDLPPDDADETIRGLLVDGESLAEWKDQLAFRRGSTTHIQRPPRDIANVYFENFFTHDDNEVFIDCGAATGDTIDEFLNRWDKFRIIIGYEPDKANYATLVTAVHRFNDSRILPVFGAIGDHRTEMSFIATGDQTAHLGGDGEKVPVFPLDSALGGIIPTFLKMDIEGAELEGLWGARETIRKHSPVLAICAYHLGSHLWEVPLLIHALNPTYRLYLRRYLEATWELVWYAVPPDRVVSR